MIKDGNVDDESQEIERVVENAEEVLKLPDTQNTDLMEALVKLEEIEAAQNDTSVIQTPVGILINNEQLVMSEEQLQLIEMKVEEEIEQEAPAEQEYKTRYGRVIKKPTRYVEQAYAVVKEIYKIYFFDKNKRMPMTMNGILSSVGMQLFTKMLLENNLLKPKLHSRRK